MSKPCFVRMRSACLTISASIPGRIVGHRLQHGDLRAEPQPDAAELQSDHAAADDDQVLRHRGDRERAGRVDDPLVVELQEGQLDRDRPGGEQDVASPSASRFPSAPSTSTRSGPARRPKPRTHSILFFLKRPVDAVGVGRHDLVLPGEHRGDVHRDPVDLDAVGRPPCGASGRTARTSRAAPCDGMQPTRRQVPPSAASFSTHATFIPSCAARMAAT